MDQSSKNYSVPALEKSISILNALAESGDLSIGEIHNQLQIPKTTAFVILNTLEKHNLIDKQTDGKYRLGYGVFQWGMRFYERIDLKRIARPFLEKLVSGTPYTAHLAVLIDSKPVYIDKCEGNGFVRFATTIGQSLPLHLSGVGKALASGLKNEEIVRMLAGQLEAPTLKSHRSIESILEDIEFVRQNGYAIEDEQMEEGIRCIGTPIYGAADKIVASISLTSLSKDLPAIRFQSIGESVRDTALQISARLGYEPAIR